MIRFFEHKPRMRPTSGPVPTHSAPQAVLLDMYAFKLRKNLRSVRFVGGRESQKCLSDQTPPGKLLCLRPRANRKECVSMPYAAFFMFLKRHVLRRITSKFK
jgi:hypothetical protein